MPIAIRAGKSLNRRQWLVRSAATCAVAGLGSLARPNLSRATDRPLITSGIQSGDVSADSAVIWARDYRIDGFRLDATHALPQAHTAAFMRALSDTARAETGRPLLFIAEDHRRMPAIFRRENDGDWGLDGVWADDFHHHVRVITAGDSHGYFASFRRSAGDLASTITHGWRVEEPAAPPDSHAPFIICIQNHDQVGNRAVGDRLHHTVALDVWRAASTLLLLAPETPLLFMGQEWAASSVGGRTAGGASQAGRCARSRRGDVMVLRRACVSPYSTPRRHGSGP